MAKRQDKLTQLSPAQKSLLLKKMAAKSKPSESAVLTIQPRSQNSRIPLTSAQKRLWFLQRYSGVSSLYNLPIFLRLSGRLDQYCLETALNAVLQRHELLRTQCYQTDDGVFQRIQACNPLQLQAVDLRDCENRDQALQDILKGLSEHSFQLEQGQLIQIQLIRLTEELHVLATCAHHIITDGWSMSVFMRDLAAFYQAELNSKTAHLPILPVQFGDYALWQQQMLDSDQYLDDLAFWESYLDGIPSVLELPFDFKRPKTPGYNGALYSFSISEALRTKVITFSRDQRVSVFTVLLSVFAVLLARYSGQHQLLIGTPFAGRNYKELEDLIGFFVNTLPVKVEYCGQSGFVDFLQSMYRSCLAVSNHPQIPFENIVERVQPDRSNSVNPLFQVLFSYSNQNNQSAQLGDMTVDLIPAQRTAAKFDLTLSIEDQGNELAALVEYDCDLFQAQNIETMMSVYCHLLETVLQSPDQCLERIGLLSDADRQRMLVDWNDCRSDYPRQLTVNQRFQQQAELSPDNIAIIHSERQITYRQLNEQANQLAHVLIERGLQQDDVVALYLHRGCDLVIAMLATLKAGATYLPLDLAYPLERLAQMHQQVRVALTITQHSLQDDARVFGEQNLLVIDQLDWQTYPISNPNRRGYTNALAYIMFTSGSTGVPKAISIAHYSIHRLVLNSNYIDLKPTDRIAQASNTAFDAATFEIWGALLNGASLVIADRSVTLAVDDFAEFLMQQRISVLFLTTALFNQIVRQQPAAFAGLEYLLFGGELVDPELVRTVLKRGKPAHFLHVYGPTESTTYSTWHSIDSVVEQVPTVPIGKPLSNTTVYVLDPALNPVPAGVVGELYIGGDGLSPGYVNQIADTASRFVPDPFAAQPGQRLYRTGDMVRWNSAGAIEFIGRVDNQVKLRGFRIELGAIETTMNAYAGINQSYIRVREVQGQGKSLVAYFSSMPDSTVDAQLLRQHLQAELPDYMVPAALVELSVLPLNPNGKIDDKVLPEPKASDYLHKTVEPPHTDTEIRLASIWQDLLGVEASRDSDFFILGGHSLLAMQLTNRIQTVFAVHLPIRDVFEHSSLRTQAKAIDNNSQSIAVEALTAVDEARDYPLSFAQERLYFLQKLYPHSNAYNMVAALKINGHLDISCLQKSLNDIVARHCILRTVFIVNDAQPRQKILNSSELPMHHLDWTQYSSNQQNTLLDELLERETGHVFKLDALPLIRVSLIRLDVDRQILVINNHHILSDGWSQDVFMQELLSLYHSYRTGQQPDLPELPVQYADYSIWQRQRMESGEFQHLLDYWRDNLADLPPSLSLPTDFKRSTEQTFRAQTHSFKLDSELTSQLTQLAEAQHCSLFMLLLAGFHLFLARYSNQQDFALGTPVANRDRQETESLIGFFSNTLVLRNTIDKNPVWLEFLAQVKETVVDAFAHQAMPFEKLVEELQPQRDLAGTPFFQVMFLFHNRKTICYGLGDLSIEALTLANQEVKFDLTLAMHEEHDCFSGTFEYNADLFAAQTIETMCRGLTHVFQQVVTQPHARIGDFRIVDDTLYRQIVVDWNQTSLPINNNCSVYDLFANSVEQFADLIAIEQGATQVSYQQLSNQVDQLAAILVERGAGPEELIGVCLPRTPRLIIALLAILKSGSAYVPLDPDYPGARIGQTLNDAEVLLVVTESEQLASHPVLAETPNLQLDLTWPQAAQIQWQHAQQANLAYVLYTSGSTGIPKGVAISHANAVTMIRWAQSVYQAKQLQRVVAGTSICFDLSVYEIFLTLASGGTLILLRNVLELAEHPDSSPGLINTVPSAIEQLLKVDAIPETVTTVNLAGEPLSSELVDKLYARPHIQQVYDLYGPSEDTTYSTVCLRKQNTSPSIGHPISNTRAYVLDAYLQPVPPGVAGELYLGGDGLARGYLGRAALTAERFVPDLFSGQAGVRLYRTGDLVRYNARGELIYLGRLDHQVKVRGFRIELGEVEAVLRTASNVDDCVVVAVGEAASNQRKLVAYVGAAVDNPDHLTQELLQLARQQLPAFMVPTDILVLKSLPLTANGKLDRKALPDPQQHQHQSIQNQPTGFVEKTLLGLWQDVLELDHVPASDEDFFELGGHSLLVLDLMTQIKLTFGKELPLSAIFQAPTIATLSRLITSDQVTRDWSPLVTFNNHGDLPALLCFHPVGGHVICYNALAKALPQQQPVYGLKAPGMESQAEIMTELQDLAGYYLQQIGSVQSQQGYRLLGYSFGGLLAYEVARQLEAAGELVDCVVMLDTAHPSITAETTAKTDEAELLISLFPSLGFTVEQLREQASEQQMSRVFIQARQSGLIPRAMNNEAFARYVHVCRTNLNMRYQPQRLDTPVTLFRASDGSKRISQDDYLGWQQVDGLDISLHWLSGQHETMTDVTHITPVAEFIAAMPINTTSVQELEIQ